MQQNTASADLDVCSFPTCLWSKTAQVKQCSQYHATVIKPEFIWQT